MQVEWFSRGFMSLRGATANEEIGFGDLPAGAESNAASGKRALQKTSAPADEPF